MPPIPSNEIQFAIELPPLSGSGSKPTMVLQFTKGEADFETAFNHLVTQFEDVVVPELATGIIVVQYRATDGLNRDVSSGTAAGTQTMTQGAAAPCALVRKRTGVAGPDQKGRIYMPWTVGENTIDPGGQILPAKVSDITATWEAFRTGTTTAGQQMVIPHRTAMAPGTPVTSLICEPMVANQRRRQRR